MGNKLSHKYKPNKHEKAWEIPDDTSSSEDETLDKKSGKRKKKTKKGKTKQKNIGKGNARSKKTSMRAKTKGKSNEADEEELSWGHPKIIITSPSDVEASIDETPKKETSVNCSSSPASGQKDADVPEASETLEAIVEIVETSEEVQDPDEKEAEKTVEEIIALVSSVKSAETCEKPDLSEVSMHVNDNTQHSTDVHDTPDNIPTTEDVVIDKPVITLVDVAPKGIRTDEESVAMETTDNRERIEKVEANIVTAVMPNSDIIYMEEVAVKPGTGNTENSKNDNMKIVTENDLQNDEVNKLKGLSIVPNIENKEDNVDTQNKLNDTIIEDDLQNVRIEDDLQKKDDPKNVKKDDHQNKGDIKNFQKDDLQKEVDHQNKDEHQKVQKDEVNKLSGSTIEPGKVNCDSFQPVLIEACCSGIRTDQQDACNQPKLESDTDVLVEESNVVTVELGSSAVVCMEEASPGVIVNPLIMRSESSSSVDEEVTPEEMNIHHQESQMLKEQDAWEKEEIKKREQLKRIRDVEEKENIQIEQPVTNGSHQEHEVSFTYPPPKSAPPVATKPSYKQLSNTPPSLVSYKPQEDDAEEEVLLPTDVGAQSTSLLPNTSTPQPTKDPKTKPSLPRLNISQIPPPSSSDFPHRPTLSPRNPTSPQVRYSWPQGPTPCSPSPPPSFRQNPTSLPSPHPDIVHEDLFFRKLQHPKLAAPPSFLPSDETQKKKIPKSPSRSPKRFDYRQFAAVPDPITPLPPSENSSPQSVLSTEHGTQESRTPTVTLVATMHDWHVPPESSLWHQTYNAKHDPAPPSSAPPVVDNKHVDRMSFRDRRKYFEQEIKHQADDTGSIGRRKKISLVSDQDLRTIKQEEEKKYGTLSKEDIRKSMDIDEEDEEMVEDMADISTRVDPDASIVIEGKEYKVEKRPQKLSARERLTPQFSVPVTASSEEDLIRSLEKDVKRASCIEDRDATPSALNERLKVTSPEVKRDARGGHDLSPAERRALEAEKRKQWRQERFKSLEADALQAQMVMTKEKMKGRRSEGSFNATDKQQPAMT